jgi:sec-independent protein translocase protein TatA
MHLSICLIQPARARFYSTPSEEKGLVDRTSLPRDRRGTPCGRSLSWNITLPIRYEWIERNTTFLRNKHIRDFFMPITIASIMNLMGPDMMVILLIVLLLFGAKRLPELARGMGRAVKEFSAARDEVERELSQSGPNAVVPSKLLDAKSEPSAR